MVGLCTVVAAVLHGATAQVLTVDTHVISTGKIGYTTYQVSATFDTGVRDVYALFGEEADGHGLILPPAYQSMAPFGSDVGPVNPAFFAVSPDCQFDSFLTIGTDALALSTLSVVGIDFTSWSEQTGLSSTDGAVFFMDPDHGATREPVVLAQLTVPTGTPFSGQINAQGRSAGGAEDWVATGLRFTNNMHVCNTGADCNIACTMGSIRTCSSVASYDAGGWRLPSPPPTCGCESHNMVLPPTPPRPSSAWTPPINCADQTCHTGSGEAALARNIGAPDRAGVPTRQIAIDSNGLPVMMPVISLGAAHFEADTVAVVQQWLAFGGTGIDTSGDYRTQPDVGVALVASKVARSSVFITSKLSRDGMASYHAALDEAQRTLSDLHTDYIDLFLVHRSGDSTTQRRETWRAMQHLRDTGVVRAIGVSNWFVSL